jgi:hypothetical protein
MTMTYDPNVAPDPEAWLALDESERAELAFQYHRRKKLKAPNTRLHALFHSIVETQAAMGDESPVRRTLERLQGEGLDRHDAVHAVGSVLAAQFHGILGGGRSGADPNAEYEAELERLNAREWLRGH